VPHVRPTCPGLPWGVTWAENDRRGPTNAFSTPATTDGPHISLVLREMWDTTALYLQPLKLEALKTEEKGN
jgi:hypothetical protein